MLATYEKRLTKTPTRFAFMVAIAVIATALITTLALNPLTVWSDDDARPVSAIAIADNWSQAHGKSLEHFDGFDNPVITASGRFISILVATIQTLWRDDVLAALRRALICAVAAGGPAAIICYMIALSGEDIVDTREHKEGMQLLRGKKGIAHLRAVIAKEGENADAGLRLAPQFATTKLREIRGTLIAGAIGSGKTRILLYILES